MAITDWGRLHGDHFTDCRVLVTGGAGFIGSHLCDALVELGARVMVIDDLSGGDKYNVEKAEAAGGDRFQFVEGSILDKPALNHCTEFCRHVFHQGALPSVSRSVEEPALFTEVNVIGTLNVLEAARKAGVERVTFAASSSAYGDGEVLPKTETMPPLPRSPYAANKLAGEHLMRAYAASYAIDTVSLRYFNVFGPRQNANSAYAGVIAAFAKCLVKAEAPVIFGDGNQSRDFTFVDNAVHANLLAARLSSKNRIGGEVLNVGCGLRVSVKKLAETMAHVVGRPDLKPVYREPRVGDVMHSLADLAHAESTIGFTPIVPFEPGLGATLDWYQRVNPWDD